MNKCSTMDSSVCTRRQDVSWLVILVFLTQSNIIDIGCLDSIGKMSNSHNNMSRNIVVHWWVEYSCRSPNLRDEAIRWVGGWVHFQWHACSIFIRNDNGFARECWRELKLKSCSIESTGSAQCLSKDSQGSVRCAKIGPCARVTQLTCSAIACTRSCDTLLQELIY
jgi:hypothetical protein